jgi:DNA-binding IclR family transcriptional regulator
MTSELAGTTRLFGRPCDILERLARCGHHGGGNRTLHERRVDQPDMPVGLAFEQMANCQHGAAQVSKDHDTLAAFRPADGAPHRIAAGSQGAVRPTPGRLHPNLGSGDLGGKVGQATGELEAVGDQYNPDQFVHSQEMRSGRFGSAFPTSAVVYTTDRNSAMPNEGIPEEISKAGRVSRAQERRRSSIQSIDRATAILKALASGPRRLGVSELADRLGLARPTVHGLLQTLQAHGFVEQDRHSDKYQLGPGLLQLGYSYLDLNELRARSIGYADRLAARTAAAVRVGVMHGASVVVVHHVFRPDAAFGVLEVGLQLPLHASSLGKAVLAFSPTELVEDLLAEPLPRLTKQTLDEAALRRELVTIRDQGVATERDEAVLGESSAAAPIFDHGGHAVGAIGVVDATERIFPTRGLARGLSAAVGEAARGVSRELGAPRWPYASEA